MRIRSIVAAVVLGAATFAFIPSASATTEIGSDPIGDSTSIFADITSVGVAYGESIIGLGLFTVSSWSPVTWTSGDAIIWSLDVNGDTTEDYVVVWTDDGASVHTYTNESLGPMLCNAPTSYTAADDYYFAGFPASCIGTPARVRAQGYINLGYNDAYDFAPSHNTFSPFAYRTTPAPPPPSDPVLNTASTPTLIGPGYWMLADNGVISNFGGAGKFGAGQFILNPSLFPPFVDIEPTPSGKGYWTLEAGGAFRSYGDALPFAAVTALPAGDRFVSMSVTPDGRGLWLYSAKGRVVPRGNAGFFGDMGAQVLNADVIDSVATPDGGGYWMVAADGGIFSFGNAKFAGSTGDMKLNKPVVSMAPDPDGFGYWLVASDGGIFAFDAKFRGSMGDTPLAKPVSGMVPGNAGYLMVAEDGGVFSFGDVGFYGSLGNTPSPRPIVAIALKRV
jgi:hypothetical protein